MHAFLQFVDIVVVVWKPHLLSY